MNTVFADTLKMQIKFFKKTKDKNKFVSDTGLIVSLRILKPSKSKGNKYSKIQIGGKTYYIHRLVYKLFGINQDDYDKKEVDHIDGNVDNNDITNLELVTHLENIIRRDNRDIPF